MLNYIVRKLSQFLQNGIETSVQDIQFQFKSPVYHSTFKIPTNSIYLSNLLSPQFWPSGVALYKSYEHLKKIFETGLRHKGITLLVH